MKSEARLASPNRKHLPKKVMTYHQSEVAQTLILVETFHHPDYFLTHGFQLLPKPWDLACTEQHSSKASGPLLLPLGMVLLPGLQSSSPQFRPSTASERPSPTNLI